MQEWWDAIKGEFSDLSSFIEVTRVVLRLTLAGILGGVMGFERERLGKSAGIRTHALVSMGTALFVLIPQLAGMGDESVSRVVQGITTGIGFIGAGTIIKHQSDRRVEGLTTSAAIWFSAAVGIAAGLGREASAVVGTALGLLVLCLMPHVADPKK